MLSDIMQLGLIWSYYNDFKVHFSSFYQWIQTTVIVMQEVS